MARRTNGSPFTAWNLVLCLGAVAIAALVMSIIAIVRTEGPQASTSPISAAARTPTFSITNSMEQIGEDTFRIPSAGLAPNMRMAGASTATRVEGLIQMIRVPKSKSKPNGMSRDEVNVTAPATSGCVTQIVEGAIWRQPYDVIVDPTNDDGIPRNLFVDAVCRGILEWESRFSTSTKVVRSQDTSGCVDGFDGDSPDGKNEIMMGFIEEDGILAVAVIWGIFSGPLSQREIVETDMLLNLHYPWGDATQDPNVVDIQEITSHEHGHSIGMAHSNTNGATMYPTASVGETLKRDILPCEAAAMCEFYNDGASCGPSGTSTQLQPFVDVGTQSRCGVPASGGTGTGNKGVPVAAAAALAPMTYAACAACATAIAVAY